MASSAPDRKLTAEEFLQLPIAERAELVDGVVVEDEDGGVTTGLHGIVSVNIAVELKSWGRALGRPFVETSFVVARDPDRVRRPDVAFVFSERLVEVNLVEGPCDVVPDLAVEVHSPSDTLQRIGEKLRDYLDAGVRLVWSVDPFQRSVVAHTPEGPPRLFPLGSTLDGGEVLPGFAVRVDELFQ